MQRRQPEFRLTLVNRPPIQSIHGQVEVSSTLSSFAASNDESLTVTSSMPDSFTLQTTTKPITTLPIPGRFH